VAEAAQIRRILKTSDTWRYDPDNYYCTGVMYIALPGNLRRIFSKTAIIYLLIQGFSLGNLVTRLDSFAFHMVWQAMPIKPGLEVNHHEIAH
jgi:hypothetical protein